MVLYFLRALGIELTRDQLVSVAAEHDLMPYFELQSAVAELEEQGYVAAVPRTFGQAYCIVLEGERILDMFQEQVPLSIRQKLSDVADRCRATILRQTQFSSHYEREVSGGQRATFRAMERNSEFLSISIVLPDNEIAKYAGKTWPDKAERIYQFLIATLTE